MTDGPDKLSIVVFSGAFERVHYAFAMASAAAAIDRPVTLFFTMDAIRALTRESGGKPGWAALPGALEADANFARNGVATFEELLDACVALGVRIMVCEMGYRAMGLGQGDMRGDIKFEDGGIVTFLNDASRDGAMLFI